MLRPVKGHPGRYLDTTSGQVLNISEYREDDKYDTIVFGGNYPDITPGTQYVFFRDIERKKPIDTNLTQQSRLSMGEEMVIDRVGASIDLFAGAHLVTNTDFGQAVYNSHLRVEVNKLLLQEGPLVKFGCGYGVSGYGVYYLTGSDGFVNIGVPSPAAVPKLLKTQTLTDKHEIAGYLTFFDRSWMDRLTKNKATVGMPFFNQSGKGFIPVKCWLHGLLKVAVNK